MLTGSAECPLPRSAGDLTAMRILEKGPDLLKEQQSEPSFISVASKKGGSVQEAFLGLEIFSGRQSSTQPGPSRQHESMLHTPDTPAHTIASTSCSKGPNIENSVQYLEGAQIASKTTLWYKCNGLNDFMTYQNR